MSVEGYAMEYIDEQCTYDKAFAHCVELLDQYDFSEFLTEGRSLWSIRDAIEEKYDQEFWNKYRLYVFDNMDGYDTTMYLTSRYNIWFNEYTDWVVRHENGAYEKARKRDSSG